MITLNAIEKAYKKGNTIVHALKEITLNIEQGEIFGIIGREGAGKSALIRCINLLEPPSRGNVIVDSCDLTILSTEGLRRIRRSIGMIFQHANLMSSRTVFENVALPLELAGTPRDHLEKTVRQMLNLSGLADKSEAYPNELNSLQKQKVAIARALANRPKVLLCEEATASFDAKTKQSLLQLLRDINEQLNLTIVLITHEIEVIKSICNRVAVLHQGEIIEQGTALDFFIRPQSEISKEFIRVATRQDMPIALRNRLRSHPVEHSNPILRISFIHSSHQEPFIADVIQQFNLNINIIQAHLETIQGETVGIMVVEMSGDNEEIKSAIYALENKELQVEVLGYAPRFT